MDTHPGLPSKSNLTFFVITFAIKESSYFSGLVFCPALLSYNDFP